MDQIALEKHKQKKLKKKTDKIKENIKILKEESSSLLCQSGKIKIRKSNKKRNANKVSKNLKQKGAIYIGHIPHGFYEDELKSYFSQFGVVTRVKLARSRRTGRSKGYGFVEFLHSDVAKIAAETMNNYLMFNCLLKCRYIPPEEHSAKMFVRTIHSLDYPRKRNREKNIRRKNRTRTKYEEDYRRAASQKKIEDFKKFFQERGIEFNFKVNDPELTANGDDSTSNGKLDTESESENSAESEVEDLTDDQYGVLEIDESDDEIQFKTPPQVKKVIKRYSTQTRNPVLV